MTDELTTVDRSYLAANYVTLEALCADRPESAGEVQALIEQHRLPRPSYVLDDGTGLFPADYFRLVDEAGGVDGLRAHFEARYREATEAQGARPDELEQDWTEYLNGTYGICLRRVTPETIVRKGALVSSLCELLMLPRPSSIEWRAAVREQVDELDALEREFTPDFDRSEARERLPTRDLLIVAARDRYPDLFAAAP